MSSFGFLGSAYMFFLIALLVVALGAGTSYLFQVTAATVASAKIQNQSKTKGGNMIMENNPWLKYALYSFLGILILVAVMGLIMPNNHANMGYMSPNGMPMGNMQGGGNMGMSMGNMQGGGGMGMPMGNMQGGGGMGMPMGNMQGGMGMMPMGMMPMGNAQGGMGMMPMGNMQGGGGSNSGGGGGSMPSGGGGGMGMM